MNWNPHNIHAAPISVRHSELPRDDSESAYRSVCPACSKGLLLVRRNPVTFALTRIDTCTNCGQTVVYEDETIADEVVEALTPEVLEKLKTLRKSGN